MDLSMRRLPDPVAAPNRDRRRCVRQKLHSPVYASFNGPETGMVVDLSELLDLHEEGFAVQTSERLEMNRALTLCLDMPETKSYIHGSGQVVWSDDASRAGIRFSALPENSRRVLKEWLFANLLIGCSNHAARTEQVAQREEEISRAAPANQSSIVVPISDRRETVSLMEAVRHEVREIGDDLDAVLQLITERALSLTGASGAALAFPVDDQMICRARSGEPAPPLGAPVDVSQGLSGECVRTGNLIYCEDAEKDPCVDPEVTRALGIASMMAVPIVSDFRVIGVLEIFSPHPHAFTMAHGTILGALVEMIPKTRRENARPEKIQTETTQPEMPRSPEPVSDAPHPPVAEWVSMESRLTESGSIQSGWTHAMCEVLSEPKPEVPERLPQPVIARVAPGRIPAWIPEPMRRPPSRLLQRALFWVAVAVTAMVVGYLVGPLIDKHWANAPPPAQRSALNGTGAAAAASGQHAINQDVQAKSFAELQKLADQGDADAQWQIGVRYHNGDDVLRDDAQAMQWFLRAAEHGNVAAQGALGAYYWAGRGVPQDLSQAYFWSAIALAQGDENSKVRLEGLAPQMTRAQVAAARQRAEDWIHQHNSAKPARN